MTRYYQHNLLHSVFIALIVLTSCNGQTTTQAQSEQTKQVQASGKGQAKLKKTLGDNDYPTIACGIQDKEGNMWFGTTGEGVYKYDGKLFTQFTVADGLSSNTVWSIMQDNAGTIWFGTGHGICRFDGNKISGLQLDPNIRAAMSDNVYNTTWSTINSVWSMLQDKSGKIWFGLGDGVYCYEGFSFRRLLANDGVINKENVQLKMVADILEDNQGVIWFFSGMLPGNEGICRFDGKMIERFKPREHGWNRNAILSKNGNLIIATRNYGIWDYDGKNFSDHSHPKEFIKPSLNYILEDQAGDLWMASDYGKNSGDTLGGLWHSNKSTEKPFTKLFNKEVYFILEDKNSHIWFSSTQLSLYRYDRKTLTKFSE